MKHFYCAQHQRIIDNELKPLISTLQNAVTNRDQTIRDISTQRDQIVAQLKNEIASRDQINSALKKQIEEKDSLINSNNQSINHLLAEKAQLQQQKDMEIEQKDNQIRDLFNDFSSATVRISTLENEKTSLIRQLKNANQMIKELREKLNDEEIKHSQLDAKFIAIEKLVEDIKRQYPHIESGQKKEGRLNPDDITTETASISLYKACSLGDSELESTYVALSKSADPNVMNTDDKNTALHQASAANAIKTVKLLLAHGANPEAENKNHQKPIDLTTSVEIKLLLNAAHQKRIKPNASPEKLEENVDEDPMMNPGFSPEKDPYLILNLPLNGHSKDMSGHHNHGTQQGVTLTKGRFAESEDDSFNFGSQKYITGDVAKSFPRGDRTISVWFKLENDAKTNAYQGGTLFSHCGSENSSNFSIVVNHAVASGLEDKNNISVYGFGEDKELRVYINLNDKKYAKANNEWIHLAVSSGNAKGTTLFINGDEVAHEHFFYTSQSKISKFGIGTLMYKDKETDSETDPMFHGNINDVRVYQRALSKDEIQSLYEYQKPHTIENQNEVSRDKAETKTANPLRQDKTQVYKSKLTMFDKRAASAIQSNRQLPNLEVVKVSNGL